MTKAQLQDILDNTEDDEEIDLAELARDEYEARQARIEELEERQHESGFYAFQDELAVFRFER